MGEQGQRQHFYQVSRGLGGKTRYHRRLLLKPCPSQRSSCLPAAHHEIDKYGVFDPRGCSRWRLRLLVREPLREELIRRGRLGQLVNRKDRGWRYPGSRQDTIQDSRYRLVIR